jgi:hypothetical protein
MKCFGENSLSSVVGVLLKIAWWVVLVGSIIAGVVFAMLLFSKPLGDWIADQVIKMDATSNIRELYNWALILKIIALPYVGIVVALQLQIIKKAQHLFANFTNNVVFNKSNVQITAKISNLLIGYSILTVNFSLLLVSIILVILCVIIRDGTKLQEEHDLTV